MARTNKKKETPATTAAPEQTAALQEQEAYLDPDQFRDMDDDTLRSFAQDLGIDPAGYQDREALIAAIAAVPVVPGPPEPDADPEDMAPPAEQPPEVQPSEPEIQDPPPEPDPDPEPEAFTPYTAKVGVPLLVLRRVPDPNSKPIGTLHRGMKVEVVDSQNGYAKLKNGTWVNESHLERQQ